MAGVIVSIRLTARFGGMYVALLLNRARTARRQENAFRRALQPTTNSGGCRKTRCRPVLCGLTFIVLLATACGQTPSDDDGGASGGDQPTRGGLIRVESQEPGSLDPPLASGSEDARIVRQLFDGVVGYDSKTAGLRLAYCLLPALRSHLPGAGDA